MKTLKGYFYYKLFISHPLIGEKAEFIVKLIHFITGLLFTVLAIYHVIYN
jgi:hypothetical protein